MRTGAHGVVKTAVVCALCKAGNLPKECCRLREGIQKGGGPMELYRQLRTVVDDLPADCVPRSCLAQAAYSKPRNRKSALNAPGKSLFRSYTKVPLCPLATQNEPKPQ